MEGQYDSESYWNRSTSKAFSFEEEDDEEDGTSGNAGAGNNGEADILGDDTLSETSFGQGGGAGSVLNLSIKSVISDDALKMLLQEQTMEERILPKGVTPEEELRLLRRQVQTTLYNPSAEVTARNLLLGKRVPLEVFKSLHEKVQLLDTVLANGGGDAIISVLLFLNKTLNRTNFYKILRSHPRAMQHYIRFLEQRQPLAAVELLRHFGRHQEAALLEFEAAITAEELPMRKELLQKLVERYSTDDIVSTSIGVYTQHFQATWKLLDLIEKERHALGNVVAVNSTPVEVLMACCRKHNNWKEQELLRPISPFRLANEQHFAPAQFEWTALNERAAAHAYADLESVFERVPTWNPIKIKQFHISFALEFAIMRLFVLQAPTSVLYLFLSKLSSAREKLELAQRVKCTRAVVDALVAAKEVGQLTRLKETLPERSEEQFYCDKAIKQLQNKRWSTDNIKLKL